MKQSYSRVKTKKHGEQERERLLKTVVNHKSASNALFNGISDIEHKHTGTDIWSICTGEYTPNPSLVMWSEGGLLYTIMSVLVNDWIPQFSWYVKYQYLQISFIQFVFHHNLLHKSVCGYLLHRIHFVCT